jgi:hypothetical protein
MENKAAVQFKVRTDLRAGATYPDMSGVCSTATTPPPQGGIFPDMSGVCAGQPPPTNPPQATFPDMSGTCV